MLSIEINKFAEDEKENKELILRNLQEILWTDTVNSENFSSKSLRIYWGTTPTGKPHIGYLIPLLKIRDFLKAGVKVTIMIADMHAILDAIKSSPEIVDHRSEYYEIVLRSTLKLIGCENMLNLTIIRGSSFQLTEDYNYDLQRLLAITSLHDANIAGTEVVKQSKNPTLGSMVYPLMQALDEVYLNCDAQLGGIDQRKIFIFAKENLGKINYKERIHFMNHMFSINGKKMSSSEPNVEKILLTDSLIEIEKKVMKLFCDPEPNADNIILKLIDLVNKATNLKDYKEVESNFNEKKISPKDLKILLIARLTPLLETIRDSIPTDLVEKAYPYIASL